MEDLVARLLSLETAWIADAQQGFGVMEPDIKSVVPGSKMAGPAFTVKCYPGSIMTVHKALIEAPTGAVIVVDGEGDGRAGALFGALMAREAKDRGFRGIVVDGAVRDTGDMRSLGFPAFASHYTPRVGVNRRLGQTKVDVTVGGVIVRNEDFILGDDDGVVVIPAARLQEVVDAGEAIQQKEQGIAEAIDRHERVADILGFRETLEQN